MLDLRCVPYDHPDAQLLTEHAQEYYVEIYGARDEDPLTPAELTPPRGGFVVGYLDDRPVAMGGWMRTDDPDRAGGCVAQIRRMYVDAQVRRRGLAAAVLARLEADAARSGAERIILATGRPQVEAIAFYRQHGYVDVAPFGFYADGDLVVFLGKALAVSPGGQSSQPTS